MLDIVADERIDSTFGAARRPRDHFLAGSQHFVDLHRDDRHQQVALVLVVIVDRADRDFGGGRNRLHLHLLVAVVAEQCACSRKDAIMTNGLLFLAQA